MRGAAASQGPTIFGMGGGGFSMEPGNPVLDDYVLSLSAHPEPRICLLPTAGGDSSDQIARFHTAFGDRRCSPSHLSLFRLAGHRVPLRDTLLSQDIIYVGGGSLTNLIAIWREYELDAILRAAWERGVVLCGLSAGSMCWFEAGVTTSRGAPAVAPGLGFLRGSNSVHYDSQPSRRAVYLSAVAGRLIGAGFGVDDGVGLLFRGDRLADVVASRPDARAYAVSRAGDGSPVERELQPRLLTPAQQGGVPFDIAEYRLARNRRAGARRGRRASARD